jgi:AraC family transcriptional regulator of adaptative response / DNA-3-methyladenine glycosylase II
MADLPVEIGQQGSRLLFDDGCLEILPSEPPDRVQGLPGGGHEYFHFIACPPRESGRPDVSVCSAELGQHDFLEVFQIGLRLNLTSSRGPEPDNHVTSLPSSFHASVLRWHNDLCQARAHINQTIQVRKPRDKFRPRDDNSYMDMDHDACYRVFSTRDARFDGRLFVAVKTTGIYCRPICPARTPKRENVVFFPSAAAAQEAGFRPCLRCRPEISPDLRSWRGTSNTVSRALALIEAGAMDAGGVEALAERLGVGERHLRRLFNQQLGASPVAVAQTRRVLLAKQLIHETQLSMTEVAMAAGFGSVRRFNETFREMYGRPPATLRRSRAQHGSTYNDAVVLKLSYRPPYDWDALMSFLSARAIPGVELVTARRYSRTIELDGAQGRISVEPGKGDWLKATISFPRLQALPAIITRIRRVFDLAADPLAIGAHLARDPALAPLVAARPGLRVPGAWDGFELAVRAILGQQITVPAATRLLGKLVNEYGAELDAGLLDGDGLARVFPAPAILAGADISRLGMPGARARALSELAKAVVADPLIFGPKRSLDEAIAQLRALAGVGEWTAQYIAMRELREPDAFPAADIGLMRAMADGDGRRPAPRQLLARAERWRPWRAYAALHLWASGRPAADAPARRWAAPARARRGHLKEDLNDSQAA